MLIETMSEIIACRLLSASFCLRRGIKRTQAIVRAANPPRFAKRHVRRARFLVLKEVSTVANLTGTPLVVCRVQRGRCYRRGCNCNVHESNGRYRSSRVLHTRWLIYVRGRYRPLKMENDKERVGIGREGGDEKRRVESRHKEDRSYDIVFLQVERVCRLFDGEIC